RRRVCERAANATLRGPQQNQLIASFVLGIATIEAGVPLVARTDPRSLEAGNADAGERPVACEGRESTPFIPRPQPPTPPGVTEMSKKIVIAAGVASGLACLMPLTALAQAAAAAASPAASVPEIARVVITAQKRKEDI